MLDKARKLEFQKLIDDAEWYVPKEKVDSDIIILKNDLPSTVAAKFEELSEAKHHWNSTDQWSIYHDNKYQQVRDDKEIQLHLCKFFKRCGVQVKKGKNKTEEFTPLKQSIHFIRDVMLALAAMDEVHILPAKKAICSFNKTLNPDTTIALANGLLNLENTSKPIMLPFTPDFYTFNYLPVAYDPNATAPRWTGNKGLGFYFTEEDKNIPDMIAQDVVHSWFKRFLLRIVNPHKIMAIIGKKRTGKGTVGRVLCSLIGWSNVSAITIASLAGPHGTYGLMNKQLGVMWDASVTGRAGDVMKAVETLKNISGQDAITVNPKGRDTIDLERMVMSILMIANEPANLKDTTGALASRFTFLQTTQSYIGNEDPALEKGIIDHELPGILNLALAAPDTIIEHPKSVAMTQEYAEMTSPYTAFANECCILDVPDRYIIIDILWAYYVDWCEKYHHKVPAAHTFKVSFYSAVSGLERYRPRLDEDQISHLKYEHKLNQRPGQTLTITGRPQCYCGIDLLEELKGKWRGQDVTPYGQSGSEYGQYEDE